MSTHFDLKGFCVALNVARVEKGLTWSQVAEQSGLNASVFSRLKKGRGFDLNTLARLAVWGRLNISDYVVGLNPSIDTLSQISSILRRDEALSVEDVAAIDSIVRTAYKQLAK